MAHGVNYYDTAYVYPGSEAALGEIMEKTTLDFEKETNMYLKAACSRK